MSTATVTLPTATSSAPDLTTARAFADEISAHAGEAEALGTVPTDLVERLRAAGLFRALLPCAARRPRDGSCGVRGDDRGVGPRRRLHRLDDRDRCRRRRVHRLARA